MVPQDACSLASPGFLTAILDVVPDPVFVKNSQLRFVFVNHALCAFVGLDRSQLIGKDDSDFFPPHEVEVYRENDQRVMATGVDLVSEETLTGPDGRTRFISTKKTRFADADGRVYIVGVIRDVSERKAAEDELRRLALSDPLTGLANRSGFQARLSTALEGARQKKTRLALLYIDLDRFKPVNDSLGHAAGDQLLIAVGKRLRESVRSNDAVARLAGDEFACLLQDCGDRGAVDSAARIDRALRNPFQIGDVQVRISASIGIAYGTGGEVPEDLLLYADMAMYRAKQRNGGNLQVFDAEAELETRQQVHMYHELLQALERDELIMYYQPLVDLRSRRPWGVEALVRWQHPTRGLLLPGDFLPAAEESGLMVPLGEWILRQVCRQAADLRALGVADESFVISVNISAQQLQSDYFPSLLREILDETGLPGSSLILELTEKTLVQDARNASKVRDIGVRLAIDDFGKEYSSLSYLRDLPADIVKIDKEFIARLDGDEVDTNLAGTIISLLRSLHLVSIAEGIEKPQQADKLRGLMCQLGQGFLFARPMPPAELVEHLRTFAASQRLERSPSAVKRKRGRRVRDEKVARGVPLLSWSAASG